MRRFLLTISSFLSLALIAGCDGGSSSSGDIGSSLVAITVGDNGQSVSLRIEKSTLGRQARLPAGNFLTPNTALAAIPSTVSHIFFTISAPDMTTITRDLSVAGRSSVTESFSVPNGNNRRFQVVAKNFSDVTQFSQETYTNLDGSPVTLTLRMNDVAPPTFAGVQSATAVSPTQINVSWNPATDNLTPSSQILYHIYLSKNSGGENFASPSFITLPGATSYTVTGLETYTTYYVTVRADDRSGNVDTNLVEKSAMTFDGTAPTIISVTPPDGALNIPITTAVTVKFSEPMQTAIITGSSLRLSFPCEGTTTCTVPASLSFSDSTTATLTTLSSLNSLRTYTVTVGTGFTDPAGNALTTAYSSTFTTGDFDPPVFRGLSLAQHSCSGNSETIVLAWAPAYNNGTTPSDIVYRIYLATTPGGENFTPPSFVTPPGATSFSLKIPSDLTFGNYYFVVRAVDAAGNSDTNSVEQAVSANGC